MSEKPEEMSKFFDDRASRYDEHMNGMLQDFDSFYKKISKPIEETEEAVKVFDLGCGTGNELSWIFKKAPNANITAVDLSEEMLKKLTKKYQSYLYQIEIVRDSYLTMPFPESYFDYIVSVYTMPHFTPEIKLGLYKKIKRSLKPDGKYIEGDCVVVLDKEKQLLDSIIKL